MSRPGIHPALKGGVHLFLGPDRARKLARLQEFERTLQIDPLDRHHVEAPALTAGELLALCRQQPAASRLRLIVVEDAHRLDQACVDGLRRHAEAIRQTACLVLLVEGELGARRPLAQLDSDTVERFPGRDAAAAKPFALADALGRGDVEGALGALHDQLAAGKEPLELLGLVAWQLNRWMMVRRLGEAGFGPGRIASVTGMREWQVERVRAEAARRPTGRLAQLLQRCWQLDVVAKSGRAIPDLAVEQLIVEVCLSSP